MPLTVKFDGRVYSLQEQIIPDASENNAGVMTPEQAKALGVVTPWQGLNYQGNWSDIGHDDILGQFRMSGGMVQLRGAAKSSQNQSAINPIAALPAALAPSVPRFIPTMMASSNLNAVPTAFFLIVDSGALFGMPGLVFAGPPYVTPDFVLLDGLSYSL